MAFNFTEAATRSGVSQPTLTRAIQRLEQELGGTLVYRDGKDSRLTALGRDIQSELAAAGKVTLLFSAHDAEHNNAVALSAYFASL